MYIHCVTLDHGKTRGVEPLRPSTTALQCGYLPLGRDQLSLNRSIVRLRQPLRYLGFLCRPCLLTAAGIAAAKLISSHSTFLALPARTNHPYLPY